jgi:hypothetical protein
MDKLSRLIRLEIYVLRKDPKVRIKLMISFLLIIYVLSYALFELNANILPFFYFGFFLVSPLIDYSYYVERLNKRFSLLIGKGFSLRQIIISKSIVIFSFGILFGTLFTVMALYLNNTGFLNAEMPEKFFVFIFAIALYNYWIILFSGIIQVRFEIIFPVRLLNILGFILFVNFQEKLSEHYLRDSLGIHIPALLLLISLTAYSAGILNKDKIS